MCHRARRGLGDRGQEQQSCSWAQGHPEPPEGRGGCRAEAVTPLLGHCPAKGKFFKLWPSECARMCQSPQWGHRSGGRGLVELMHGREKGKEAKVTQQRGELELHRERVAKNKVPGHRS